MHRDWEKISLGTRIRHRSQGYEGWIDGWTDDQNLFEGHKTNPDGKQCRIYIHGDRKHRYSAEEDLQIYDDISEIMVVSAISNCPKFHISRNDFREMPISCEIHTLGFYHARPLLRTSKAYRPLLPLSRLRTPTPVSDDEMLTAQISNLKWYSEGWILGGSESDDQVAYFVKRLDPILKSNFPIVVVPSHYPGSPYIGLIELARRLSSKGRGDASSCFVRFMQVHPQHVIPDRSDIHRHLESIEVKNKSLVASRVVLLLDDIVTTGTSLMACKKLLLDAGASGVICLALGKAVH